MTKSDNWAYRGSLLALLAVFVVVLAIGFISDMVGPGRGGLQKAEGFMADLQAIATQVPRLPDGSIIRQGALSTAWLDDVGALPERLQAMAGSLRGGEHQRSLGLVQRGPWSFAFRSQAKLSLIWTELSGVPKAVCEQIERAAAKHPDQVAYLNTSGDPPLIPAALPPDWLCRSNFVNLVLVTMDPPTEVRRLSADIQNAINSVPTSFAGKAPISGSSAPFQVSQGEKDEPGFIQRDQSGIRVTINNVPLALCELALLIGPKAFAMDKFEAPDGKMARPPPARPAARKLCDELKGRLIMSRQ
jgi:hypothetical protein